MAIIPLNNLGATGLNSDIDPHTLPATAWTSARNVRFELNSVVRAPRFREIGTISRGGVTFVTGWPVPNDSYEFLVGFGDGGIMRWNARGDNGEPGLEADLTPNDILPFEYREPITVAVLQDVIYWNRPDRPLYAMMKAGDRFKRVPNWNRDWRCKAIRSFYGQTVAIGVFRNGRYYPTMIKTSDFAGYGSAKAEWVATTSNSASENLLGSLGSRLIDGAPLNNRMILYAEHETWDMTPTLTNDIYAYKAIWRDLGVISQNCVAEVENVHFVFGPHCIWTHDGTSYEKASVGMIQNEVYRDLVVGQKQQFFVLYDKERSEVNFCFVSNDPECTFPVGKGRVPEGMAEYPGCNKAMVYNTFFKTWSVSDLPYLVGGAVVSPYGGTRWEEMTTSWADTPGTWDDYADRTPPIPLYVSTYPGTIPFNPIEAVDDTIANVAATGTTLLPFPVALGNDTGTGITVTAVGPAAHGRVALQSNGVLYTPANTYVAADTFPYTITDQYGQRATANVSLTLQAPATLLAVDDALTVETIAANSSTTASGYRSNAAYEPTTLLYDAAVWNANATLTIFGKPLTTVTPTTTIQNVIDAFNGLYRDDGYQMLLGTFGSDVTEGYAHLAVVRSDPYISDQELASLDRRLFGTSPVFVTYTFRDTNRWVTFPASRFLANDIGVNATTKIISMTAPTFAEVEFDAVKQTLRYYPPNRYGNGTSYGNVYKDTFTYTIRSASGVQSTATVNVTYDNGVANGPVLCPKVADVIAGPYSYGNANLTQTIVKGVAYDAKLGDQLFMWVESKGSTTWTVEDGWNAFGEEAGVGGFYLRTLDADYYAKLSAARYRGTLSDPYPFVTTANPSDVTLQVMSFTRPPQIDPNRFILNLSWEGKRDITTPYTFSWPAIQEAAAYRYTYVVAKGLNGNPPTVRAFPTTQGAYTLGDTYYIDRGGEVMNGPYPEGVEINNARFAFALSFVLNETSCAPQ